MAESTGSEIVTEIVLVNLAQPDLSTFAIDSMETYQYQYVLLLIVRKLSP